ncbi:hypothetical protein MTBBW1_520002 [Desulfamplus magnetovallimortis]|uniref:Uncharacterized protein n=1 Tax=Desulfamplus magnetovallimortis TaxID=1246637 RepID=A0A1W1HHS7_9BACT|nr:hypothetical protein MTBBW1_520002 [Desulfamplus magnetovallimortis]
MSVAFFDHSVGQTSAPDYISMAGEGENNAKRVHSKDLKDSHIWTTALKPDLYARPMS